LSFEASDAFGTILTKVSGFASRPVVASAIVSVFKRLPSSHVHVRTPIMLGMIVLLVVLLSAFCYYRVSSWV
jgi:hypothetical protein